jgi:hypothetical protein
VALVIVVFCQAEFPMSGLSLLQGSPTEFGVSESDGENWVM